jgi:ABC-type nitrate/sulfonate/bicarbonate transport system substrate-binding protein
MFVAIDRGFFGSEGLEVSLKYGVGIEGLAAGETDFVGNDMGHVAFVRGADVRRVCGHSTRGGEHVLVVRSSIDRADQLKEVTVGGEENIIELRNILAHYGVDLDRSGIKTPRIEGSHPKQFEALKGGVGDGAMLGDPWWVHAVKLGYKNMGSGGDYGPGLPTSGISVTAQKIAKEPEVVRAFVRAYVKSIRYCRESVAGTLDAMMKYSSEWGVDDLGTAKMVYDAKAPYWSPEVDTEAVARLLKLTAEKLGKPAPRSEGFLDLRFLAEALRDS